MNVISRIVRIVFVHKWQLLSTYAVTIGATASYLALPRLFGETIDLIAEAHQTGTLSDRMVFWAGILILAIGTARGVLSFAQNYLAEHMSQVMAYEMRNKFYDKIQHLSFAFHDKQHTGNLMSRAITDIDAMRMFVNTGMVRTPYFLALFIIVPVLLIRLDWRLALLSMSFMPVVVFIAVVLRLRLRTTWLAIQEKMADLSTVLQENLSGAKVVKAFASDEHEEKKFDANNAEVAGYLVKAAQIAGINGASMVFAYMLAISLILWYGGSRTIDGYLTPGELAQFMFYLQILALPVRSAGMVVSNLARTISAGERLFEVLDAKSPVQESEIAIKIPRAKGHIQFEHVGFGYNQNESAISDIEIDAQPGQVVALLGAPGSGKSTLVNLIPRFYDIDTGRLTIDGTDTRDITLESLRANIGFVQQDVFLFAASVRDNIAFGREYATTEEVVEAAKVAQIHNFIVDELEDGYDTVLGERGANLSGGQRQRFSIARAVLLDPPVLVLDDSTSSVDAQTEALIQQAMESVIRGRTTFVIAHRLSTVHKADQILVLDEGKIVERGTHTQLLALGGSYRGIYELQLKPQEDIMLEFDVSSEILSEA
jgi:ATP-binding cassette subfamily B protein